MHIAAYKAVVEVTIPGVEKLRDTLHAKATEFKRSKNRSYPPYGCYPLTVGQELSGYVRNWTMV
jgi:fumarate hydratase class II